MNYKYVVLNANSHTTCARSRRRYRCFIGISLLVGVLVGIYFLVYSQYRFRFKHNLSNQKLLLISIDAFRYNLREKAPTPNLDQFVENGVSVDHMLNIFPTVTLPNHQTIVTGLFAENHGVIGNKMYDRKTKEKFSMGNTQPKFWNDAVPIWIENELQGHESGVCFWPGYNVLFGGKQAKHLPSTNYTSPFGKNVNPMPLDMRADLVIDWLKKPNVNFATLYIGELDTIQHKVGPDPVDEEGKKELQAMIVKVDNLIGKIMSNLKKENLQSVNVIIVGDHGQSNTNRTSKVIDLRRYVNLTKRSDFHGDGFIYAKPGQTQHIYDKMKEAEKSEHHMKVYLKEDIPDEFHVRKHPRTGDIMYYADEGWTLWTFNPVNRKYIKSGYHGYSNKVKNMHPAFLAYGPSFRNNHKEEVVYMEDLYSLMCHILQIKPRQNDGKFSRIKTILEEYS